MNTTMRFNITLPRELGLKLKTTKNWSSVVAESLKEKFAHDESTRLKAALAEGYSVRSQQDGIINSEYDHMIIDGIK